MFTDTCGVRSFEPLRGVAKLTAGGPPDSGTPHRVPSCSLIDPQHADLWKTVRSDEVVSTRHLVTREVLRSSQRCLIITQLEKDTVKCDEHDARLLATGRQTPLHAILATPQQLVHGNVEEVVCCLTPDISPNAGKPWRSTRSRGVRVELASRSTLQAYSHSQQHLQLG